MLKVQGREDLIRDPSSKAILSKDIGALEQHRRKKEAFKSIKDNADRINKIEEDVSEIKSLLLQLLRKE